MPAVSHAGDLRWNAKIHAVKKPLLAGREYKGRCNLHLDTLVPELVPDFSPREKLNEHLPASFAIRSRRFSRFQHLTNISVIMHETVPPLIYFLHPHNCEMNAAFLEPFSFSLAPSTEV